MDLICHIETDINKLLVCFEEYTAVPILTSVNLKIDYSNTMIFSGQEFEIHLCQLPGTDSETGKHSYLFQYDKNIPNITNTVTNLACLLFSTHIPYGTSKIVSN